MVINFEDARRMTESGGSPSLILFGTAWGITAGALNEADYILEPIKSYGTYNHLSVRTAAAIIFDRLLGQR